MSKARCGVAAGILAAYAAIVFLLACALEVGYYDGFAYLQGAAAVRDESRRIPPTRTPLLTLALIPVVAAGRTAASDALFRAGFLLAAVAACGALAATHRLARRIGNRRDACWALALAALLPDVLHYGPFPMHDLFAAGLVLAGLERYTAGRARGDVTAAGILWGLAIATRYPLAVVPPAIWAAEALRGARGDAVAHRNARDGSFIGRAVLLPAFVVAVLALSLYSWKTGSVAGGARMWFRVLANQIGQPYEPATNPWWEYLADARLQLGAAGAALAAFGVAAGLASRRAGAYFAAVVALALFSVHSALGPKESRYLLPVWLLLPALALRGLARARVGTRAARIVRILLVLLALPAAARTLAEFRDPIYLRPYWRLVLEEIRRVPSDREIVVTGWMTPLAPRNLSRDRFRDLDEYRSIHHFGVAQIAAFSGRPMRWLDDASAERAIDSGAVAVRLYPEGSNRTDRPAFSPPIVFERLVEARRARKVFYPPR